MHRLRTRLPASRNASARVRTRADLRFVALGRAVAGLAFLSDQRGAVFREFRTVLRQFSGST